MRVGSRVMGGGGAVVVLVDVVVDVDVDGVGVAVVGEDDVAVAADVWGVGAGDWYVVVPAAWRLAGIVSSPVAVVLVVVELWSLARQGRR